MPHIQRNLHPRYRKKNGNFKEEKRTRVLEKRKEQVLKNLYTLPLDIKIKIFQMSIESSIESWKNLHKINMKINLDFISIGSMDYLNHRSRHNFSQSPSEQENPNSEWLIRAEDVNNSSRYSFNNICERAVRSHEQEGIQSMYLGRYERYEIPEEISHREWSNRRLIFWYHDTCRCITCDRVRYHGHYALSKEEQKKYNEIWWEEGSDQWKSTWAFQNI